METLAYLYSSVEYEDPHPAPELRSPDELVKLSNSAVMGLVGSAVIASTIGPIPAALAVVRQGDQCVAVGDVQQVLKAQGYYTGAVDTIFGSGTRSAVSRFQQAKGLTADGIVGPRTAAAMGFDVQNPNSPYLVGKSCNTSTPNPGTPGTGQEASGVVRTSSGDGVSTRTSPNGNRVGSGFADGATVFFNPTTLTSSGGFDWVQVTRGNNTGLWVARTYVGGTSTPNPGTPGTGQEASGVVRTSSGSGVSTRTSPNGTLTGNGFADGATVFYDITSRTATGGYTWVRVTRGNNSGLWVAQSFLTGTSTPNPGTPGTPGTGQEASGVVRTSSGSGISTRTSPNGTLTGNGFADGATVFYDITSRTATGGYTWVKITRGNNSGLWVAQSFLTGTSTPNPGTPGTGQEASGVVRTSSGSGVSTRTSPNGTVTGNGFADGATVFYDITSRSRTEGYTWVKVTRGGNSGLWVAENFIAR